LTEAYGCEFAQENKALTPENTIPWQKFTETGPTRNTEFLGYDLVYSRMHLGEPTKALKAMVGAR
jgi:hypothetical protein